MQISDVAPLERRRDGRCSGVLLAIEAAMIAGVGAVVGIALGAAIAQDSCLAARAAKRPRARSRAYRHLGFVDHLGCSSA